MSITSKQPTRANINFLVSKDFLRVCSEAFALDVAAYQLEEHIKNAGNLLRLPGPIHIAESNTQSELYEKQGLKLYFATTLVMEKL
jgi:hypothetical protein